MCGHVKLNQFTLINKQEILIKSTCANHKRIKKLHSDKENNPQIRRHTLLITIPRNAN